MARANKIKSTEVSCFLQPLYRKQSPNQSSPRLLTSPNSDYLTVSYGFFYILSERPTAVSFLGQTTFQFLLSPLSET